jgi:hypothetical protein
MPALADTDIKRFRSGHTVGVIDCLGGPLKIPNTEITGSLLHELWDRVNETQATSGSTEFRCFYLKNDNDTNSLKNPILVIKNQAKSPNILISIGWGTSVVNGNNEQTIGTEFTFPTNVQFKDGDVPNKGAILGRDIPPNGTKAVWVKRTVFFGAAPHEDDGYEIRLYTDNVKSEVAEETEDNVPEPDEKASFIIGCNFTQRVKKFKVPALKKSTAIAIAGGGQAVAIAGSGFASAKATASQAGAEVTLNDSMDGLMAMKQMNANTFLFCNALDGADGHKMDPEQFYAMLGKEMSDQSHICFGRDDAITRAIKRHWANRQKLIVRRRINLPDRDPGVCYYSKNRQNVHWLFMDTSGNSADWDDTSDQFEFVQSDLQKANANPSIDWIFVMSYRTGYGTQTDDNPRFLSATFRDTYHPIFQESGVHIVFTQYFLNYQRLHCLQYNAGNPNAPTAVHGDDEPDYVIPAGTKGFGDGCIFVNVGPCGRDPEDFVTPSATYMVVGDESMGYLYGYIDNTAKKLTCKYKKKSHSVVDTFTITKTE